MHLFHFPRLNQAIFFCTSLQGSFAVPRVVLASVLWTLCVQQPEVRGWGPGSCPDEHRAGDMQAMCAESVLGGTQGSVLT